MAKQKQKTHTWRWRADGSCARCKVCGCKFERVDGVWLYILNDGTKKGKEPPCTEK